MRRVVPAIVPFVRSPLVAEYLLGTARWGRWCSGLGAPRNLVFALGELRVEIEVSDTGIEGQLIPPEPGQVWLLDATGPIAETTADEVGCFSFPAGRRGPIRIECVVAGGRIATEWISS